MQSSKTKLEPEQETHEFSRRFQNKSITNSFVTRNISSNSKCRARKRSSINKMLVFKRDLNKSSRHSSSWKDKSVLSKLAKVDFKPGYSVSGKWLQNIHQDTFSTKNSKFYKNEQEANCSRGFGIKGDVEERSNKESPTSSKGVFEQFIPCEEKRWRLSPCNQSRNVEPVHSFSPFQNGKLFSVKAHNTEGRLNVQTGFEGCILQCSIGLKLEEVCKASKEGDPLRVHVEPVFWIRPNTKGVYKVIENSNLCSEKDQCQSDNIFGQYVDFELHNTRNSHQPRHSHISPAELGFIINIKKSMLHPCQKIEFLRMELDSIKVTLSLTPEKVQKLVKTCQNNLRSHQERIQGVDQWD